VRQRKKKKSQKSRTRRTARDRARDQEEKKKGGAGRTDFGVRASLAGSATGKRKGGKSSTRKKTVPPLLSLFYPRVISGRRGEGKGAQRKYQSRSFFLLNSEPRWGGEGRESVTEPLTRSSVVRRILSLSASKREGRKKKAAERGAEEAAGHSAVHRRRERRKGSIRKPEWRRIFFSLIGGRRLSKPASLSTFIGEKKGERLALPARSSTHLLC